MNVLFCVFAIMVGNGARQPAPLFTDAERANLQTFWSASGRYTVCLPPDAVTKGVWQVRLTPEGSIWLLKFQNATGARGVAPTTDPTSLASESTAWKTWVQAKIAQDRAKAQQAADAANKATQLQSPDAVPPHLTSPNGRGTDAPNARRLTPNADPPTPIPPSLLAAVGNPPSFAAAVASMQHCICFEDGETYSYIDNVNVPIAYAYYRFPQGVAVFGQPSNDADLDSLFSAAGMSDSEQRISRAVSKLEGSFESINTYDTGFVSVGFLQFITFDDGKHSLCEVMQKEKQDRPDDFSRDFHRYGIDVTPDGVIDVVDAATGAELTGPEAVRKLVDDKRLIAVFQRAGRHSEAFRVAQIQIAKSHYWPTDDPITIVLGKQTITGRIGDVVKSEAGIATLFDRKVNRGTCEPISAVVAKIMKAHRLMNIEDAADYERDIIAQLKYRGDFLKDGSLGQPADRY